MSPFLFVLRFVRRIMLRVKYPLWALRQLFRHVQGVIIGETRVTMRILERQGRLEVAPTTRAYSVPRVKAFAFSDAKLTIGGYCSLSTDAIVFVGGMHPTDSITTFPHRIVWGMEGAGEDDFPTDIGDGFIGSDVWMGDYAVVMPGLRIGHGAVIGAGSFVTRDVPDYGIVGGVPAKLIKYRFEDEAQRAALVETAWWDWPEKDVREAVPLLAEKDVEGFLAYAAKRQEGLRTRTT